MRKLTRHGITANVLRDGQHVVSFCVNGSDVGPKHPAFHEHMARFKAPNPPEVEVVEVQPIKELGGF